jgi:hypothetical protein
MVERCRSVDREANHSGLPQTPLVVALTAKPDVPDDATLSASAAARLRLALALPILREPDLVEDEARGTDESNGDQHKCEHLAERARDEHRGKRAGEDERCAEAIADDPLT